MKSRLSIIFAFTIAFSFAGSLGAEDWKTLDGKVYEDVKVVRAEPDAVTILDRDGGARVPLANLSVELQKRFNYDPVQAAAAATARTKIEAINSQDLMAEARQLAEQKMAELEARDAKADSDSLAADVTNTTHYTMGALALSMRHVAGPSGDSTHHSMSELIDSIHL